MRSLREAVVLKIDSKTPDKKAISRAAKIIRDGGLVAFPTETVYGLAANLLNKRTVIRLYRIKSRPRNKPFTVHISSVRTIKKMSCEIPEAAKSLIKKFWPGPLTVILKSARGKKIGFRMPANRVALELIKNSRVPVVAPSANISGAPAPKSAGGVLKDLKGEIDLVLDSGPTDLGIESTVVDLTTVPAKIMRQGAIKAEEIFKVLGYG